MVERCEECGSRMQGFERGWRAVHAGDPDSDEVIPAFYCPVCARRELDDPGSDGQRSHVAGSAPGTGSSRMNFQIQFELEGIDVLITTDGVANADGFLRLNRAMVADPRFRPGMTILVDHSALDTRQLSEDDLRETAGSFVAMRERIASSRIAFVVADKTTARKTDRARRYAQPMETEMRGFYSRTDAMSWLDPNAPSRTT
jgi:hypothetical protein